MEPLLLITHAGATNSEELAAALEVLRTRASVEVAETSNPGELDGALHRAGSRPIVVAGSDAALHAVIATLHRRNDLAGKTLGHLPLGAENDFARDLGIPLDPTEAATALLDGTAGPMDLIVDELGEVAVNHVHIGVGVQASWHGATWQDRLGPYGLGLIRYPVGAVLTAVNPPCARLRIEVDGVVAADVDRQVLLVSVDNPGNGTVDVTIAFATDPLTRLGHAIDLVRRGNAQRDDIVYLSGSRVSVSGEDFWISADGEINGPERRRTWHVEPAAYSLLVP